MSRSSVRIIVAAACGLVAASAAAQDGRETRITLTVGPTFVDFAGFGGSVGAAAAQLQVSRYFSPTAGGELSAFMVVPAGGASSQPECVAGATCQSRATPGMVNGLLASAFTFLGESGFRVSAGGGGVKAFGGEGLGATASLAGSVGLDWVTRGNSRLLPTFGVHVVQLARPIAGARQFLLPGAGFTF